MYFGETHEEIYEGVKAMNALAKKVGRIIGIIYVVVMEILGIMLFSNTKDIKLLLFCNIICAFIGFIFGSLLGKDYAWGWIAYKQKHNTKNLGKDLLGTATHNASVSYIIGGRKMVGWSLISSAVALGIVITIGYWKGHFYRSKYEKLEKKLGKELGKI